MENFFDDQRGRTASRKRRFEPRPIDQILTESIDDGPVGLPQLTPEFSAPEAVPIRRMQSVNPTALDRILNEAARGAKRAISDRGPIGLDRESIETLRRLGIFRNSRKTSFLPRAIDDILDAPRILAEGAVRTGATLADIGMIALDAILEGGISATGQAARELGESQGMAKRLERDLRMTREVFRRR